MKSGRAFHKGRRSGTRGRSCVNPVEHPLTAVVTTSISAMVRGKSQVHRDVNPNNVLVAEVLGNSAVAKISDLTTVEAGARAQCRGPQAS